MATFTEKAELADEDELPVVEGYALRLADGEDPAGVAARLPGSWQPAPGGGWLLQRLPAEAPPPSLGEAWEEVRALGGAAAADPAEPFFFVRRKDLPEAEARRRFGEWGWTGPERRREIAAASTGVHWSLEQLRLPAAWRAFTERHERQAPGHGARIALFDTGYTPHPRLRAALEPGAGGPVGADFVPGDSPGAGALDPLEKGLAPFRRPGHGSRVASLIAAGQEAPERPWGVAPGARLLPFRIAPSEFHLSLQSVCDAFTAATTFRDAEGHGVDVIALSFGSPIASQQLYERVWAALDAGIVVVAAAGDDLPGVLFPARLPGVIACAASNALEAAWRSSGLGEAITITAPGERIWHEEPFSPDGGETLPEPRQSSGTAFAAAEVAGLAALWIGFHGRRRLLRHCDGRPELLPFLFRHCLESSARPGRRLAGHGYGAGLADAEALLREPLAALPLLIETRRKAIADEPQKRLTLSSWRKVLHLPAMTAMISDPVPVSAAEGEARLAAFLGAEGGLLPDGPDPLELAELAILAGSDLDLSALFAQVAGAARQWVTPAALRLYLLSRREILSPTLAMRLAATQSEASREWLERHPEAAALRGQSQVPSVAAGKALAGVAPPRLRRLKAYAFDPSLQTSSADIGANEITIPVTFEPGLEPGPVGDYLEVVDIDPASGCAYSPVDLNHPWLLAQDGVARSESDPHFHQQMVYAVAMKTIGHFEEALGRPIFWSSLRPWDASSGDAPNAEERFFETREGRRTPSGSDQFVRRLRLYPHALRAQNAYYSPPKRAILFGYFPATDTDPGAEYPGGLVFTCLAHDIVAHEMTHAILDGMHYRFVQSTNPDVFAFHEAFADIIALLQRFTYRELIEDQIARSRGRLEAGTLMTRLALQFGQSTGRHQALRDALGHVVKQFRERQTGEHRDLPPDPPASGKRLKSTIADTAREFGEELRYQWKRFRADPLALSKVDEPHARGSFLVAAVFDAFLTIYESRIADLKRIATGGSGVLPDGDLHPDLVRRIAREATHAADHVLRICIRAMDYVPPIDITFGEYLRALITADTELVPDDDRHYRVAFIEAFRKWGIYPRDVRTLSEESLRWSAPGQIVFEAPPDLEPLRRALMDWQPGRERGAIFEAIQDAQRRLHRFLRQPEGREVKRELLGGIDPSRSFEVCNLRPARRVGATGRFLTEMVVEVLQSKDALPYDPEERARELERRAAAKGRYSSALPPFYGGATLVVGLEQDRFEVRYAIYKRLDSSAREAREREFLGADGAEGAAAEYSSQGLPDGFLSDPAARALWLAGRNRRAEDMRASSCACRRTRQDNRAKAPLAEPFALLHQR